MTIFPAYSQTGTLGEGGGNPKTNPQTKTSQQTKLGVDIDQSTNQVRS